MYLLPHFGCLWWEASTFQIPTSFRRLPHFNACQFWVSYLLSTSILLNYPNKNSSSANLFTVTSKSIINICLLNSSSNCKEWSAALGPRQHGIHFWHMGSTIQSSGCDILTKFRGRIQ